MGCLFAAIIIAAVMRTGSGAGVGGLGGACACSDATLVHGARLRSRLRPRPAPWRVGCLFAVMSSAALKRAAARRSAASLGDARRGGAAALLESQFLGEGILCGDKLGDLSDCDTRCADDDDNRAARAAAATRSRAFERKRKKFQTVTTPHPRNALPPYSAGHVRFVEGGRVSEEVK